MSNLVQTIQTKEYYESTFNLSIEEADKILMDAVENYAKESEIIPGTAGEQFNLELHYAFSEAFSSYFLLPFSFHL